MRLEEWEWRSEVQNDKAAVSETTGVIIDVDLIRFS